MSREPAKNPAASIRARLLTLAQSRDKDFQCIPSKYDIIVFRLLRAPWWCIVVQLGDRCGGEKIDQSQRQTFRHAAHISELSARNLQGD